MRQVRAAASRRYPTTGGELVQVEIVAPRVDLAVSDLEDAHDRQLERLAWNLEHVHSLGHHNWTLGHDIDEMQRKALDARRPRADEGGKVVRDSLPARDRLQRDVVIDGVVAEKCGELGGSSIVGPAAQNLRTTSIGLSI